MNDLLRRHSLDVAIKVVENQVRGGVVACGDDLAKIIQGAHQHRARELGQGTLRFPTAWRP